MRDGNGDLGGPRRSSGWGRMRKRGPAAKGMAEQESWSTGPGSMDGLALAAGPGTPAGIVAACGWYYCRRGPLAAVPAGDLPGTPARFAGVCLGGFGGLELELQWLHRRCRQGARCEEPSRYNGERARSSPNRWISTVHGSGVERGRITNSHCPYPFARVHGARRRRHLARPVCLGRVPVPAPAPSWSRSCTRRLLELRELLQRTHSSLSVDVAGGRSGSMMVNFSGRMGGRPVLVAAGESLTSSPSLICGRSRRRIMQPDDAPLRAGSGAEQKAESREHHGQAAMRCHAARQPEGSFDGWMERKTTEGFDDMSG
ncbi:hypothetical protein TgHK011_008941 [Trichoderma gracile]|nr:hypothetical protein TgHK011_008941 [Trichoderma gracile]